uniref:Uncharacterized protein n=1 Tax=Anguilla anguilla TaxID=7936 RepID=A0A0E9SIJ0_ANGAN
MPFEQRETQGRNTNTIHLLRLLVKEQVEFRHCCTMLLILFEMYKTQNNIFADTNSNIVYLFL